MSSDNKHFIPIPEQELKELKESFLKADGDGNEGLDLKELREALKLVGLVLPGYKVRALEDEFKKSDINKDGKLSLDEFQKLYSRLKYDKDASQKFKESIKPLPSDVQVQNKGNRVKSIKESEIQAFTKWINQNLAQDPDLNLATKPIAANDTDLFSRCKDGLLLCKLINCSVSNVIDERSLNKGKNLTIYQQLENLELALRSAEAIGCHVISINSKDIYDGKEHLILSLVWQTIQIGLFAEINLIAHPGLILLLKDGEVKEDLMKLSKEEILLRWVNYHLSKSSFNGPEIKNFGEDIKDSKAYIYLLNQIAPLDQDHHVSLSPLNESDSLTRAEKMLREADKMNAREFVSPNDVVGGNQRLNIAFVANLFNKYPSLNIDEKVEIIEETREEKTFRNWMNSIGVKPKVNYLYTDLQDCLIFFQLYDIIKPGSVDSSKVTHDFNPKKARFEKLNNCNYAIEIGKSKMNIKLVGVDGSNLLNGEKTYTLALLWQLMRAYILSMLEKIACSGNPIGESGIIEWANKKLKSSGKESSIQNFADPIISNSRVICDIIDSIKPNSIKYDLLKNENTTESNMDNARYTISMARRIGARVFALPEDIVEVKQKMIMTIFATLMIVDIQSQKS